MTRLLDIPWVVNEETERISTHGGLASIDFNGTERERREAMRLVAQAQEMVNALLHRVTCNRLDRCMECDASIDLLRAAGVEVS